MSREADDFFGRFKDNLIGGLNTCLIGRIERYNPTKMQADVILLPDRDLIVNVPVATLQSGDYYIRVPFKKWDYVLVVFSQRDIDGIMNSGEATPTDRKLSLDDAIVIGGINLFNAPLPAADSDKLVIGQKNGAAKITIGGGSINLTGNVFVNGTRLQAGGNQF